MREISLKAGCATQADCAKTSAYMHMHIAHAVSAYASVDAMC